MLKFESEADLESFLLAYQEIIYSYLSDGAEIIKSKIWSQSVLGEGYGRSDILAYSKMQVDSDSFIYRWDVFELKITSPSLADCDQVMRYTRRLWRRHRRHVVPHLIYPFHTQAHNISSLARTCCIDVARMSLDGTSITLEPLYYRGPGFKHVTLGSPRQVYRKADNT